jgi:hypothetical protein
MILDSFELISELTKLGARSTKGPSDPTAFCPMLKWVDELAKASLALMANEPRPRTHRNDCENQVRRALVHANDALNAANLPEDCGEAIAEAEITIPMWLKDYSNNPGYLGIPPTITTHFTTLIRTSDAGWRFYERMTGQHEDAITLLERGNIGVLLWVRL